MRGRINSFLSVLKLGIDNWVWWHYIYTKRLWKGLLLTKGGLSGRIGQTPHMSGVAEAKSEYWLRILLWSGVHWNEHYPLPATSERATKGRESSNRGFINPWNMERTLPFWGTWSSPELCFMQCEWAYSIEKGLAGVFLVQSMDFIFRLKSGLGAWVLELECLDLNLASPSLWLCDFKQVNLNALYLSFFKLRY